jgi:hypothetical protein
MAYYRYLLENTGVLDLESLFALDLELFSTSPPFTPATQLTETDLGADIDGASCWKAGGSMGIQWY